LGFAVGEPLDVKQNDNPTIEELNEVHAKYVASLQRLFEKHKLEYGIPEIEHLQFI